MRILAAVIFLCGISVHAENFDRIKCFASLTCSQKHPEFTSEKIATDIMQGVRTDRALVEVIQSVQFSASEVDGKDFNQAHLTALQEDMNVRIAAHNRAVADLRSHSRVTGVFWGLAFGAVLGMVRPGIFARLDMIQSLFVGAAGGFTTGSIVGSYLYPDKMDEKIEILNKK